MSGARHEASPTLEASCREGALVAHLAAEPTATLFLRNLNAADAGPCSTGVNFGCNC